MNTHLDERFWSKVVKRDDGCWEWIAARKASGYGVFNTDGRFGPVRRAHVLAYEDRRGPVPDGLEIDHLCRNRWCVNPDHMEPVTHRENLRRGLGKPRKLTDQDVADIRRRYSHGSTTQTALAKRYGVSQTHVSDIVRRKVRGML